METIDAVELTRRLIAFDTRNPPGYEEDCAAYLGDLLGEHGFRVERHAFAEGRTSIVARIGDLHAGAPLCFTGHIDVVPLGAEPWSVDPFAGEVDDGKLYGRGSSDMKSGVAAFVAAVVAERQHLDEGPGAVLVITAGEETGCEGARYLAERRAIGAARAMIVAEPTSNYPMLGHKGALWLRAISTGVTAHGSMPERGVNAAFKAGHALCKLEDFGFNVPPHEVMGPPTLNVGTVSGGMNINSVPDRTEIGIDIRTVPGIEHERLKDGLRSYLSPEIAEIDPIVDLQGIWTDSSTAFVREVFGVVRGLLSEEPEPRSASYFTDASILTPAYGDVPTIVLGPGEANMAHQTDEYCLVDRIPQAVDIYRRIIRLG